MRKSFEGLVEKLLDEVDKIADDSKWYHGLVSAAEEVKDYMKKYNKDPLDEALNSGDGAYRP
jgi:hypothetical protein